MPRWRPPRHVHLGELCGERRAGVLGARRLDVEEELEGIGRGDALESCVEDVQPRRQELHSSPARAAIGVGAALETRGQSLRGARRCLQTIEVLGLASTANRPAVSQKVGSPSAASAPALTGSSAATSPAIRRVSASASCTDSGSPRRVRASSLRSTALALRARRFLLVAGVRGRRRDLDRRAAGRADEEELIPLRHGLFHDRLRDGNEDVLLDGAPQRAGRRAPG
jgi:hypothetical protein